MRIDVLGTLSVTAGGHRREIRAGKVRAMLATLALDAGRSVSHEELAEELWCGHQPKGNARNALQAHATRLRRVLDRSADDAPAVLRSVGNGYLLDVPRECVDSNTFLDLAARGAAAVRHRPERAVEQLQASLQLWRGPALLDAGDGLRCRGSAALLEERRLAVWEDLVSARLSLGDDRQAVADLRPLVFRHPLRERFCEQLMLALYRAGRQGEALELFRRTRRRLDDELGVLPGMALRQRHAEILAHDPALLLATADAPKPAVRTG